MLVPLRSCGLAGQVVRVLTRFGLDHEIAPFGIAKVHRIGTPVDLVCESLLLSLTGSLSCRNPPSVK